MSNTTILAFDSLQQAAPETTLVAIHAVFSGFCELEFELPVEIAGYFKTFLAKAKEHVDGHQCRISLDREGRLDAGIVLPDRYYRIIPLLPSKEYRIEDPPPDAKRHRVVVQDAVGHEKVVYVLDEADPTQEGCTE